MESSVLETVQKDLEEVENLIQQAKRTNVLRVLKEQKVLLESTLKAEKIKVEELEKSKSKESDSKPVDNQLVFTTITKYSFENADKFAKLYFTEFTNLKTNPHYKLDTDFKANSFTVCLIGFNGRNYKFSCNNLNKSIVPSESYCKATASGLIVYLKKEKSDHWDSLEKKKGLVSDENEGGIDKSDPSGGLMNMMKEMYQNGDEQTKRMIAESWMKAQEGKMGDAGAMGGLGGMGDLGGMDGHIVTGKQIGRAHV